MFSDQVPRNFAEPSAIADLLLLAMDPARDDHQQQLPGLEDQVHGSVHCQDAGKSSSMRRGLPHLNELVKTLRCGNHAGGDSEAEDTGHAAGLGRQFQTQRLDVGCGGLKDQHVLYVFSRRQGGTAHVAGHR